MHQRTADADAAADAAAGAAEPEEAEEGPEGAAAAEAATQADRVGSCESRSSPCCAASSRWSGGWLATHPSESSSRSTSGGQAGGDDEELERGPAPAPAAEAPEEPHTVAAIVAPALAVADAATAMDGDAAAAATDAGAIFASTLLLSADASGLALTPPPPRVRLLGAGPCCGPSKACRLESIATRVCCEAVALCCCAGRSETPRGLVAQSSPLRVSISERGGEKERSEREREEEPHCKASITWTLAESTTLAHPCHSPAFVDRSLHRPLSTTPPQVLSVAHCSCIAMTRLLRTIAALAICSCAVLLLAATPASARLFSRPRPQPAKWMLAAQSCSFGELEGTCMASSSGCNGSSMTLSGQCGSAGEVCCLVQAEPAAGCGSAALARATSWANVNLTYCQSPRGQHDFDSDCSPICERVENPAWDAYRSDCSGLVSYSYGIEAPGRDTSGFAPFENDVSFALGSATDLAPGDAINSMPAEHIMLFHSWLSPDKSSARFLEEPGCSAAQPYAKFTDTDVTINDAAAPGAQGTIWLAVNNMTFVPIRFNTNSVPC